MRGKRSFQRARGIGVREDIGADGFERAGEQVVALEEVFEEL